MKKGAILATLAVFLSACGPWPEVDAPQSAQTGEWPTLLPIEDAAPQTHTNSAPQAQAQRLSSRAASLRNRARIMRQSVPDQGAMDALRARLAR